MAFIKFISRVYAAPPIVGDINNDLIKNSYGNVDVGLSLLISNILRFAFVVAGIVAFFNFILAGFQYMTAGGDSKALQKAWDRIWQSILGLIIISGSFVLAAIFGYLIFKDPLFMLRPRVYGP